MTPRRPVLLSLFTYRYGEGFEVTRTLRRRSRLAAVVTAKRLLPVVETVRYPEVYHRDVNRAPFVVVQRGARSETIDAEIRIVESVGERGVW